MYEREKEIIDNYLKEENTDYAIMVRGQWGVGKTFFIKNYLMNNEQYLYKSVSGINSIEEFIKKINIELFLLINNKNKIKKFILNTESDSISDIIDLLPYINKSKNILKKKFIKIQNNILNKNNNLKNTLLVIDDLERLSNSTSIEDLLHRIHTQFISKGVKVIFISNEEIINNNNNNNVNNYNIIKEKTIDITTNFTTIINNIITEKKYKFIEDKAHINELINLFINSKHLNIRTFLQYLELSNKLSDIIINELVEKQMCVLLLFILIEINSGKKNNLIKCIKKYEIKTFNLDIENNKDYDYFNNYIDNIFHSLMYSDTISITNIINDIRNYIISFYLEEYNIKKLDNFYTETTKENLKFNESYIFLSKLENEQLYNNEEIKECLEKISDIINDYKINGNNSSICNDNIIKNIKMTYENYIEKYDDNLYKDEKEKIKSLLDELMELEKYDFSNLESDEIISKYNMYLDLKNNTYYSIYNEKFNNKFYEEALKKAYINTKNKILDEILIELKNKNKSLLFNMQYDMYYKNINISEIIDDNFLNKLEISPFNIYFIASILNNKNIKLEKSKYDLINDFINQITLEDYDYNTNKSIDYLKEILCRIYS